MTALTYYSPPDYFWSDKEIKPQSFIGLRHTSKEFNAAGFWSNLATMATIVTNPATVITDTTSVEQRQRITIAFVIKLNV